MAFMVRLAAEERRAQARAAAREVLATGSTADRLTLRMVAERAGTPLPTLTYVYPSIGALLTDLRAEFESEVAANQLAVGSGGLVAELGRMIESYVAILGRDPANIEILRWQFLLIGHGEIMLAGGLSMESCLRRIQERSGEHWQMPIDELSVLTQSMISGMHVQFFVQGADQVALRSWLRDAQLIVGTLGRLAFAEPTSKTLVAADSMGDA